MPKKFMSVNNKATIIKEGTFLSKEKADLKKSLAEGELLWAEKCKKFEEKLKRRKAKMEKREDYLTRKRQLKALLKSESQSLYKSNARAVKKVTKFAIQRNVILNKLSAPAPLLKTKTKQVSATNSLTENMNRLTLGEEIARTIDAALSILGNNPVPDNHLEKRLKAAHKAYEETRIKELRQANPALKNTQLREIAFKEWLRMQPKL